MRKKPESKEQLTINTLFKEFKNINNRIQINSQEDLANTMISLIPIVNSSHTLTSLFVADVDAFMDDMGIELNEEMRAHLIKNVPLYKYKGKKVYKTIKSGKQFSSFNYLHLIPTEMLFRKANMMGQIKGFKQSNKVISPAQRAMLHTVRNSYTGPVYASPVLLSTTRGWTVVLQIAQSYITDLFEDIMETQFTAASILAALTGQKEVEGLAEPWHDIDLWFLVPMHLRIEVEYFNIENEPSIDLGSTGPYNVNAKFKINGKLTIYGAGDPQIRSFSGTAIQSGKITRREDPYFDYILDFQSSFPKVLLKDEGDDTVIISGLVAIGMQDYFRHEIPTLPLFSLPDSRPFISFETSDLVSVDGPGYQNALTWTFGEGPNRVIPFDRYIILPGNNITVGNSPSAMHFSIRERLPELPMISPDDENLVVKTIDVELRNGYIEVTGKGVYHTCSCYPDVDFSYSVKIRLSIDYDGNLVGNADDPDVNLPDWVYFLHALLLSAIGFGFGIDPAVGAGLGLIGTAIAESSFGSEVAEAIEDQLNIDMNVEKMLNDGLSNLSLATNGWISITAKIRTVQITPNGIFFHGNLTNKAPMSSG